MRQHYYSIIIGLVMALVCLVFSPPPLLASDYKVIDIGSLNGPNSYSIAMDINDSELVCGNSTVANGQSHAFIWDQTLGMRDLGTLPGNTGSSASAINALGQVVGISSIPNGNWYAVRWDADGIIHQLQMIPGSFNSAAYDINDLGQVVGFCRVSAGWSTTDYACVWDANNQVTNLGPFWAWGINNLGMVSGVSTRNPWTGVTWNLQQGNLRQDVPNFDSTYASRINDLGHISGNDENHARFWNGNITVDIGSMTGGRTFAQGLNIHDQIVGYCYTPDNQGLRGYLWSSSSGFQGIDPLPGGVNTELMGINNAGVMVGWSEGAGISPGGHAVLVKAIPQEETIWPDTIIGITDSGPEGNSYELGTIFRTSVAGIISHARVYALPGETGEHTVRMWRNSDNMLVGGPYNWDYHGAVGWITLDIDDISIIADTDYTIAISTGNGDKNYPYIHDNLINPGNNGAHLSYPVNAGVFSTELGTRPTSTFQWSNYLRDIIFIEDIYEPDTTITAPPADSWQRLPINFAWTGTDNNDPRNLRYSWNIDGGNWSTWDSAQQVQIATLSAGLHTFQVKACDAAGNEDNTPASISINIDIQAPNTEFISSPAEGAFVTALPINFTWSGSDDITPAPQLLFSYRLDGGTWTAWSDLLSISLLSLTEGYHTFEVKSRDMVGLEDETPAQCHFTLDLSRPDTFFNSGPAEGVTLNTMPVSYSFSGLDSVCPVGELQYSTRLDNAAWSAWSNNTSISIHITNLGAHTLQVKARDLAGWEDSTPAIRHFILTDTLAPETELIRVPGAMNGNPAIITWQGSDNVTPANKLKFSWRLNGGEWSPWSTTKVVQLSSLIETMPYTFEVRALDLAGLIDPTPALVKFTIDITPPNTTITYGPADGSLVDKPITFYWVGSDNMTASTDLTFSCRLDSGAWSSWSTTRSRTYTSLPTGTHRFQVRAKDRAGNIDPTPDFRTFIPDNTMPNTVILVGPTSNSKVPLPVQFQWLATDNLTPSLNLRYSWRIDNGTWSPWSLSSYLTITSLISGKHTFYVRACDISNNEETSPASRIFYIINPTALDTFIIGGPAEGSLGQFPVTFSWSGVDDTTPVNQLKYSWRVSAGPWSTISGTTSVSFNTLPWDGAHSFEVRACDSDGNFDATPALRHFSVDGTPPNTYESWIQRQVIAGQPFTAYWSGSDNLTASAALTFRWRLGGNAWSDWNTAASTVLTLTHGSHIFEVQSRDAAGNIDSTPLSVLIYAQ